MKAYTSRQIHDSTTAQPTMRFAMSVTISNAYADDQNTIYKWSMSNQNACSNISAVCSPVGVSSDHCIQLARHYSVMADERLTRADYKDRSRQQALDLPFEICTAIAEALDENVELQPLAALRTLCNLRLVRRSFACNILPHIVHGKTVDVYLDAEGLDGFEALAASPPGQHIRNVCDGNRRVEQYSLLLKQVSVGKYFTSAGEWRPRLLRAGGEGFAAKLQHEMKKPGCRWTAIASMIEDAGLEVVENGPVGCRMLKRDRNFRPDDPQLRRFLQILSQLPDLRSISANENIKHKVVILHDINNIKFAHFIAGRRDAAFQSRPKRSARCLCLSEDHPGQWACDNVRTMNRFFLYDLARLNAMLSTTAADCFTQLTKIHITFPNGHHSGHLGTPEQHQTVNLIKRCTALRHLRLWTPHPPPGLRELHSAGAPIGYILGLLIADEKWRPPLRVLELSSIDPLATEIVGTINAFKLPLKFLNIKNVSLQSTRRPANMQKAF